MQHSKIIRSKSDATETMLKQQNDGTTIPTVLTHVIFSINDYWPNGSENDHHKIAVKSSRVFKFN